MVPVPVPGSLTVTPLLGFVSVRMTVSLRSFEASSRIGTVTVLWLGSLLSLILSLTTYSALTRGSKVRVPDVVV